MKKNIFLVFISTLLLTGCTQTAQQNENQNSNESSFGQQDVNNGNQNQQNSPDQKPTDENSSDQTGEQQNQNTQEDEYTATVMFSGSSFGTEFSARTRFENGGSNQTNVDRLIEYCDKDLEYENLVTNLNFTGYVQSLDATGGIFLCLGSQSTSGKVTWFSGEKIYKVSAKVINYNKYIEYNGQTNVDRSSHFLIDSDDYSLELSEKDSPKSKEFMKTYETGVTSFSISSSGGRVLVEEITITWRG